MADKELPDLPSDEELGITEEDRREYEHPEERPELSQEEMVALLGETFGREKGRKGEPPEGEPPGPGGPAGPGERPVRARAPEPAGPRSRWRGPVTLLALVVVAAAASTRTGLPRPVAANASDTVFSSARAMSMLIEMARRPHPTGSPEHSRVRDYLLGRLRSLGLEPEVQLTTSMVQRPGAARVATVRNVVARLPGTASTGAILVTAHYDSRELSPGAADDGAGVAAILEAIRALGTGAPLRNDVIVLITDAEELGLLGARAFAAEHPWMEDVSVVLSFEMRGAGGPSIMFETGEGNGWIVRALRDFDPHPFANSLSGEIYRRMPNDTDFSVFKQAGKQGLNFAAVDRANVYHQATDRPENLSEATLQHHGIRALAALRWLGGADLSAVSAPDVVYFTFPLLGLVVYGRGWVLPIAGGLVALFALTTWVALRRGSRLWAIGAGAGLAVVGGAAAYVAAGALEGWATGRHPEAGSLAAALYHSEGWFVLAIAALALTIVTALHALARRWLGSVELSLGAALVPLGGATFLAVAAPDGAMNLQWPLAAALLATLVVAALGARAWGLVGWLVALALTLPVLFLLVPVAELLWLSLSIRMAGLIAVLAVLTLHLCMPALDALRHPNGWWTPAVGLVVAAGATGLGLLAARTDESRPAPSTLVYAYEHGTGSAFWVTDDRADAELDAEALAWAAERAGAPFTDTRDLTRFGYLGAPRPVAPAPLAQAAPPEVRILGDSIDGNVRRVTLSVRSQVGAEVLVFQLDTLRTRIVSVAGRRIERPDSVRWAEHWGVPDSVVVLELEMPADEPIGLHVVEHHLRPTELVGAGRFERPATLAPDVVAMSDRAVFSYSVAAFADPQHAYMPAPGAEGPPMAPTTPSATPATGAPQDTAPAAPGGPGGGAPASPSGPDAPSPAPGAQPGGGAAAPSPGGAPTEPDTPAAAPDTSTPG